MPIAMSFLCMGTNSIFIQNRTEAQTLFLELEKTKLVLDPETDGKFDLDDQNSVNIFTALHQTFGHNLVCKTLINGLLHQQFICLNAHRKSQTLVFTTDEEGNVQTHIQENPY